MLIQSFVAKSSFSEPKVTKRIQKWFSFFSSFSLFYDYFFSSDLHTFSHSSKLYSNAKKHKRFMHLVIKWYVAYTPELWSPIHSQWTRENKIACSKSQWNRNTHTQRHLNTKKRKMITDSQKPRAENIFQNEFVFEAIELRWFLVFNICCLMCIRLMKKVTTASLADYISYAICVSP